MMNFKKISSLQLTVWLIFSIQKVSGQNWLIKYLLPPDYNPELPPIDPTEQEVFVNTTIKIHTFRIVHGEQNFRTDLDLCMKWNDYRLQPVEINRFINGVIGGRYEKIVITDLEQIWYPGVYFRNSVSTQITQALLPLQYAEIWPDTKQIHMCTRMRVYFICLLNLSNFPFDQNHCYFELENLERLKLNMEWIHSPDGNSQVRVMHRFTGFCQPKGLNSFQSKIDVNSYDNVFNNQSCVYGALRFVRHINYYIIRYYTGTFLCMCIPCIGPWITIIAYPGRTILSATVLYAVIRISHTGYDDVPARDVVSLYWWFWCCQFFIYVCLMEYAMAISWFNFAREKTLYKKLQKPSPDGYYFGKNGWYKMAGAMMQRFLHFVFGPIDFAASPLHRNKVDYFARIFLPSLMLLWVFVYLVATLSPWATKYHHLIPNNYDKNIAPLIDSSVLVNVSMRVHTFEADDNQLNLETDMTMCLKWHDPRILDFNINSVADLIPGKQLISNLIILTDYDRLWLPQVYFPNSISSEIVNSFQYVEVYSHDKVLNWCSRIDVRFVCRFILSNFPFDEHYCRFKLQTLGTSIPYVRLQMLKHLESPTHNPQFVVRESLLGYCDPENEALNRFQHIYHKLNNRFNDQSCIYGGLRIVRHVNYYIIRYYLLSFLLVCISFIEFWYPVAPYSANGRMVLTVIVLVNIIGLSREAYNEVPCKDVASLSWWMWGCQFFVYLALCEFAMAYAWYHYIRDKKQARQKNIESPDGYYFGKGGLYRRAGQVLTNFLRMIYGPIPFHDDEENRNKIDYLARVVFPFMLIFYTLIYIVATIPAWATKYDT